MAIDRYTVRASYVLESPGHGARETWFFQQDSNSLDVAYQTWLTTLNARKNLLGKQGQVKALELSMEFAPASVPVLGDSVISYVYQDGVQTEGMIDADLAVLFKAQNAIRTKRRNYYLRMAWDSIESDGGRYSPPQQGQWQTNLLAWLAQMVAIKVGYIRYQRGPIAPNNVVGVGITGYTSNAQQYVTLTADADLFTESQVGKNVKTRIFANKQGSALAGSLVVVPQSTTTAITIDRIAVAPFSGTGWRWSVYEPFFELTPLIDPQKIVRREIGRPLLVSVGRRKGKARV